MITYKSCIDPDIPSLEKQKAEILECFNFKLMAMVMNSACRAIYNEDCDSTDTYETWKTYNIKQKKLTQPTAEELKEDADRLLSDVIKDYRKGGSPMTYICCGGFKAICRFGILELEFIVESWSWD